MLAFTKWALTDTEPVSSKLASVRIPSRVVYADDSVISRETRRPSIRDCFSMHDLSRRKLRDKTAIFSCNKVFSVGEESIQESGDLVSPQRFEPWVKAGFDVVIVDDCEGGVEIPAPLPESGVTNVVSQAAVFCLSTVSAVAAGVAWAVAAGYDEIADVSDPWSLSHDFMTLPTSEITLLPQRVETEARPVSLADHFTPLSLRRTLAAETIGEAQKDDICSFPVRPTVQLGLCHSLESYHHGQHDTIAANAAAQQPAGGDEDFRLLEHVTPLVLPLGTVIESLDGGMPTPATASFVRLVHRSAAWALFAPATHGSRLWMAMQALLGLAGHHLTVLPAGRICNISMTPRHGLPPNDVAAAEKLSAFTSDATKRGIGAAPLLGRPGVKAAVQHLDAVAGLAGLSDTERDSFLHWLRLVDEAYMTASQSNLLPFPSIDDPLDRGSASMKTVDSSSNDTAQLGIESPLHSKITVDSDTALVNDIMVHSTSDLIGSNSGNTFSSNLESERMPAQSVDWTPSMDGDDTTMTWPTLASEYDYHPHCWRDHSNVRDSVLMINFNNWGNWSSGVLSQLRRAYSPFFPLIVAFAGEWTLKQDQPLLNAWRCDGDWGRDVGWPGGIVGEACGAQLVRRYPGRLGYVLSQDDVLWLPWNTLGYDPHKIWALGHEGRHGVDRSTWWYGCERGKDKHHCYGCYQWHPVLGGVSVAKVHSRLTARQLAIKAANTGREDGLSCDLTDAFYIPGRLAAEFRDLSALLRSALTEVELAYSTIIDTLALRADQQRMRHMNAVQRKSLEGLLTHWRDDSVFRPGVDDPLRLLDWFHPVKLSSPEAGAFFAAQFEAARQLRLFTRPNVTALLARPNITVGHL